MNTMPSCFFTVKCRFGKWAAFAFLCFKIYKSSIVFYEAKQAIELKRTSRRKTRRCKCYQLSVHGVPVAASAGKKRGPQNEGHGVEGHLYWVTLFMGTKVIWGGFLCFLPISYLTILALPPSLET